ncbi:MAG: GAF domain-containing protein [Candidatus Methylomirabilales bacterium]
MPDLTLEAACARIKALLDDPPPGLPPEVRDLLGELAAALPRWAAGRREGGHGERGLLRTVLDSVPVMINYFHTDGSLAYVNPGMGRITGWAVEDVRGQDALALFHPDPANRRQAAEFIARADGTWADFRTRTRDGRSMDPSWTNLRFSDGSTLGIGIDITARKRIEEVLRLSEDRFGRTLRSCRVAMALSRADGTDVAEQRRTAETLARQTAQVEALRAIGVEITRELDLEVLLALVTRRACDLLQVPVCGIFLYDQATGMLHLRHWSGDVHPVERMPRRLGEGLVGLVAQERAGRYVNDYRAADIALPHVLAHTTITASMAEPLVYRDQLLGALSVNNQGTTRQFCDADQELLRLFASQAAIAIENARLLEAAGAQQRELRSLARRLTEVEEGERKRLSRELHDRVGQNLTSLSLVLNMLKDGLPAGSEALQARLDDARSVLKDTMRHVRDLMGELRPPVLDDYGLLAALRWYAAQVGPRSGLAVEVEGQEPAPRLSAGEELALFRIAQEAVTNALKHARARRARIALQTLPHAVRLEVADDGVGLAPPRGAAGEGGWGLLSMRERAAGVGGCLTLESRSGQGTRVIVTLPR